MRVTGKPDLGSELTSFLIHLIQGSICEGTQRAPTLQMVTPLNKGTKGKLRPVGCAAAFRRVACGSLARSSAKVFGSTHYAVGRKATLVSLSRDVHSAIKTKKQRHRGTVGLQLGIQPRGPRNDPVTHQPPDATPRTCLPFHPLEHYTELGSQENRELLNGSLE